MKKPNSGKSKIRIFFVFSTSSALLILLSCSNNIKFNKRGWNEKNGLGYYDLRDDMITDVLSNHKFINKDISFLRSFFGVVPIRKHEADSLIVEYNIVTDFGWDIDPVYTKDLLFFLNSDSTVIRYNIVEYRR